MKKIKIRPVCRIQVADAETKIRMISLHAQGLSPAGRLKPWKVHKLKLFFKKHKKMKNIRPVCTIQVADYESKISPAGRLKPCTTKTLCFVQYTL